MNRRQLLKSFLSLAAGSAVVHCRTAFSTLSTPQPQTDNSSETLTELLQNTIQLCVNGGHVGITIDQREAVEARELCQQALTRLQRSTLDTPAFWQACADSVSRLEATVSSHIESTQAEHHSQFQTLRQLRNLKRQLTIQTVQAIGATSRLV